MKQAVAAGALRHGEALPSVRKLAAELRINPNTVARAYQNLEREGVKRLRPHARQLAVEGHQLRLGREEIMKLLEAELEKLGGQT